MKRLQSQICRTLAAGLLFILPGEGIQAQSLWGDVDRAQAEATVSAVLSELKPVYQSPEAAESIWIGRRAEVRSYGGVAVDSLTAFLDSDDEADRLTALWMLDRIGGLTALPGLLKAAKQKADRLVQLAGLRSLVEGNGFVPTANLLQEVAASETEAETLDYAREALGESRVDGLARETGPNAPKQFRPADSDATAANRGVRAIGEDAMEASTLRVDGRIMAVSRAHARPRHLREVVRMGPQAVPTLAEYAWSGSTFEWIVAKELLTQLGGAEIVEPLSEVAFKHPDSYRRFTALIALVEGSNFRTIARALREVEQSDPDSEAGRYARQVLTAVQHNH